MFFDYIIVSVRNIRSSSGYNSHEFHVNSMQRAEANADCHILFFGNCRTYPCGIGLPFGWETKGIDGSQGNAARETDLGQGCKMVGNQSDVAVVVCTVPRVGRLKTERNAIVGTHDGVMCRTLPCGRLSRSGVW